MFRTLAVAIAVTAAAPALAAPIFFDNRADFDAALNNFLIDTQGFESFENETPGSTSGAAGFQFDDFGVTSSAQILLEGQPISGAATRNGTDGQQSIGSTFGNSSLSQTLTFTFDEGINAFSLDIFGFDTGDGTSIDANVFGETETAVATGREDTTTGFPRVPDGQFFGVIDPDQVATVFSFTRSARSSDFVNFDAVSFATFGENIDVPAPGALGLMLLGLAGLRLRRR
ncbi:MAG: PEP-CTERM sorting domain-containing protein [Pacificimonas sp.]